MTRDAQQPKDPADVLFICSLEDLNCLHDYMIAAMAGDDLSELPRLWNQQIGVIRSRPSPAQQQELDALDELYKFVDGLDPDYIIRERISIIKSRIQDPRSRPHPAPAQDERTNGGDPWNCIDLGIECLDPEQDWCDWPCDNWLVFHDAAIARQAREDVLDAISKRLEKQGVEIHERNGQRYYVVSGTFGFASFMKYLESLRGPP